MTCRPNNYNHPCELDPLLVFNLGLSKESSITQINYDNSAHQEYISHRPYVIDIINSLISFHGFGDAVRHLAVLYLDNIIFKNPNFKYELVAYACFVLASKSYLIYR